MKPKMRMDYRVLSFALVVAIALFSGCGGGGGDGSSVTAQTGTVAIFIKDAPTDEFEKILVTVTEVSLIPVSGAPVVIYQNAGGCEIDLLEYREEDFLLTLSRNVPAGAYSKVRLQVSNIELVPKAGSAIGSDIEVKLPSGKIDLNPRGAFTVVAGGSLSVRIDMDANKAIHVHPSRPGWYIFRPVVFVDIEAGFPQSICPKIVHGTIDELIREGGQTTGFVMSLAYNRGKLTVKLSADTDIFGPSGTFVDASALAVGQEVRARGRMDASGALAASLVIIGDVVDVLGTATSSVTPSTGLFGFTPFTGEELVGPYNVRVDATETLILADCGTTVGPDAIRAGMVARVFGKLVSSGSSVVLRAVAVILRTQEIKGVISAVGEPGVFTVSLDEGGTADVLVTGSTPVFLEGDGTVSADYLTPGRRVRVLVDPSSGTPFYTAVAVYIEGQKVQGTVQSIEANILLVDGLYVRVPAGATILDLRNDGHLSVTFQDIAVGDEVVYFGLSASGVDYEAPVVLIVD